MVLALRKSREERGRASERERERERELDERHRKEILKPVEHDLHPNLVTWQPNLSSAAPCCNTHHPWADWVLFTPHWLRTRGTGPHIYTHH